MLHFPADLLIEQFTYIYKILTYLIQKLTFEISIITCIIIIVDIYTYNRIFFNILPFFDNNSNIIDTITEYRNTK